MAGNLSQFKIRILRYLSLREEDIDPKTCAHKHPWHIPKVVCNAARFARHSPWRLAAWADTEGLAFGHPFFALWPKDGVSEYALAAILCSPIANAFSFENDLDKNNRIFTLKRLPIPAIDHFRSNGQLAQQSRKLHSMLAPKEFTPEPSADEVRESLVRLDAAVLDAYELSPREQRRLLDQFSGWDRPVAAPFRAYFPDHFKDVISLQDFVAITYDWDTVNERRCDLIEKEVSRQLMTAEERSELDHLQDLADLLVELKDPYPIEELHEIIDKLKAEGKWKDTI